MLRDRAVDLAHLVVVLAALANPIGPPTEAPAASPTSDPDVRVIRVSSLPDAHGCSDLAFDAAGRGWAVTERAHTLVPIDGGPALPITGIPDGMDLESLAFTGPDTLLLGTERDEQRSGDALLEARREGDRVVVTGTRTIDYAALGVRMKPNHGIEGLCVVEGHTVAALETPVEVSGQRYGALVVDGRLAWLALTSKAGKVSALTCTAAAPDRIAVWAIERHFGIARILRFTLAPSAIAATPEPAPGQRPIVPELWVDLVPLIDGVLPNLEGLALERGELWLVDDDDPSPPGTITGVRRVVRTATRAGS